MFSVDDTALIPNAFEVIEICHDLSEEADALDKKTLEYTNEPPENIAVYLAPFYYAELGVANQFLRLLTRKSQNSNHRIDIDVALAEFEFENEICFASRQREAIHTALSKQAMILTGGPGTGKTTTTVGMIRLFELEHRRIALTAPTGRAAKRLSETTGREAKTIHRLLEFSPIVNKFKRNRENPLEADVVIVDEMSMVELILMNRLMQAVGPGTTLILIGDIEQLPSVGAGNVLKCLIDSEKIPVVKLTEIFRQEEESMIVTNAHRINAGEFPKLTGSANRNFFFLEENEPEAAVALICTLIAERLPQHYDYHPMDDIQLLCPMRRGTLGSENLNKQLQPLLNPNNKQLLPLLNPNVEQGVRGWEAFCVGDKVMQVRNNYDYDVFNGDIGRITGVNAVDKKVRIQFPDKFVDYDTMYLNELVLAYATTIHKAQGSEYTAVVIPLHTQHYLMLQRNLLYTGITRAKEMVVLVGTKRAIRICIENNRVTERNTYLAERLRSGRIESESYTSI